MSDALPTPNESAACPPVLDRKSAARLLGVSPSWLKQQDLRGTGPIRLKFGKKVVYPLRELITFAADHIDNSRRTQLFNV